jgi:hypothetical protein
MLGAASRAGWWATLAASAKAGPFIFNFFQKNSLLVQTMKHFGSSNM